MINHKKEAQPIGVPGGNAAKTSGDSHCPIRPEADFSLLAFNCSHCVLKQIRESLIKCQICTDYEHCDLHEQLNTQVDRSLSALNEAWGW